jgi:hypothetical protein
MNRLMQKRHSLLLSLLWIVLLAACGQGTGQTTFGSIAFKAHFNASSSLGEQYESTSEIDVCVEFGIQTIAAKVIDTNGSTRGEGSWPCDTEGHRGTINRIPSGTGYRVVIEGIIGESARWRGEIVDVTVVAGQTTYAGTVEMSRIDNYTVTATAGAGGSIDPSGDQTVNHGDSISFAITADPGFFLSSILINESAVTPADPFVIDNVTADTTIHAEFAPVVFVDADAPGGGDGRSWANAFNTLQEAINNAPAGADIWVGGGTYELSNQVSLNRVVHIYGGFSGDERLQAQRDATANPTRIDGGLATRCLFINADATLNGLWIQNGRHIADFNGQGGGIFVDDASPHLIGCIFENNASTINSGGASGGAIYINGGSPVIDDCRFENNFTANGPQPSQGGAIYNHNGFPTINDTVFIGNRAPGDESAAGAIYNSGGSATITRCRFTDNYAGMNSGGLGGAIFNGGGMHVISGSVFRGNLAEGTISGHGGAIYNWSSVLTLTNSIFTDNEARHWQSGRGGAIYNFNSDPAITNCTFFDNRAVGTNESYAIGAAILNMDSRPQIVNSIFWGNLADQLAAVFDEGTSLSQINHCNMDHYPGNSQEGTGNISADPLLDARGHLRPGSLCIGQGDNASAPDTDIDGEPRPQGGQSDIGADEFVDGDGDAMPDYWETIYGLNTGTDDSGGDLDGDRVLNEFEYRFDLNPDRANPVLDSANRGFYQENGDHDQNNDSTPTGRLAGPMHRSYFIFPLDSVADPVVTAVLRLEVVNYQSSLTSDDLELFDVTTDPATLEQSGTGQTAIFDDLGSGTSYSILPVGPGDVGQILEIPLPASALADINAQLGGSFSVGLVLNFFGVVSTEYVTFSTGSEDRVHQLILSTEQTIGIP